MKSRENKGITLIALIVTIIIILILVGITINLLLGDNGLIQNAKKSKFMTCFRTVEEKVELYKADKRMPTVSEYEETSNKTEILPVGEKLDLTQKSKITTLVTEIEKISGKSIGQVNLYWIDKEKISVNYKHQYVIDIDTEQIYDYEGETFFGSHHHTMEETTEVAEEPFIEDPTPNDISDNKIYTIEDLMRFSYKTNNKDGNISTFQGETITLMNNLDFQSEKSYKNPQTIEFGDVNEDGVTEGLIEELNKGKGFLPISYNVTDSSKYFLGTFDGNNKSLTNLNIVGRSNTALFAYVSSDNVISKIKNLELKNINLEGIGTYTAGIVAQCNAPTIIENCRVVNGKIKGKEQTAGIVALYKQGSDSFSNCSNTADIEGENVGGIIGSCIKGNFSENNFYNLYNLGNIKSTKAGGIIGVHSGNVTNIKECYNTGNIESSEQSAGIINGEYLNIENLENCYNIGEIKNGSGITNSLITYSNVKITSCYNTGNITNGSGLINSCNSVTLYNCYNSGTINGSGSGLISSANFIEKIEKCYNTGDLISEDTNEKAGLVGKISKFGNTIKDCYNKGNIKNGSGLIGVINDGESAINIINCYNEGEITSKSKEYIGGIIGRIYVPTGSKIENTHNNSSISGNVDNIGGIIGNLTGSGEFNIIDCQNNANISGTKESANIGGIIGKSYGPMTNWSNCYNTGDITSNSNAGGILCLASGNIKNMENCNNQGKIKGKGTVGGIIGTIDTIQNANKVYNEGEIENLGTSDTGGIFGKTSSITKITNVKNTAHVKGEGSSTSGIVGSTQVVTSTIEDTFNTGKIEGKTEASGIIKAYNINSLKKCYNTGEISAIKCGGIMSTATSVTMENVFNSANITSTTNYAGGIVGEITNIIITNAYVTGNISSTSGKAGSVAGNVNGGTLTNTYYAQELSSICSKNEKYTTDNSEKKALSDMQKDEFVTTLGSSVWTRSNSKNNGLPYFK